MLLLRMLRCAVRKSLLPASPWPEGRVLMCGLPARKWSASSVASVDARTRGHFAVGSVNVCETWCWGRVFKR
eukprot:4076297-Pyramimonas_sp.AAC.1